MRGDETPNTLWNLCGAFEELSDTWLAQAKATDVELYEATLNQPRRRTAPPLVEESLQASLLKGIHELLQQLTHYTAANAPKGTKRPTVRRLPRPVTAQQLYARAQARAAYDHVEAALVFIPTEQWEQSQGGG
jgi:hypothetical protein